MKWLDGCKIRLMLVGFVAAIVLGGDGRANADFIFGTPTNLGPTVNRSSSDGVPSLSADGLSLFFNSTRSGGYGNYDIWVTTRTTIEDDWGSPVNLGPTINTSYADGIPSISADGLSIFFSDMPSPRPGGYGGHDIWVTERETVSDPWGQPVNLGLPVNSTANDHGGFLSADGLSLFISSTRPGGLGSSDIWVTTRSTKDDPWGEPVNLGPPVNTSSLEDSPTMSADGRMLLFMSDRPGGHGGFDAWMTTRPTADDNWGTPVNLGPVVNTSAFDGAASLSPDGSTLFFMSSRPGGYGSHDLYQVSIEPIVDLDGDGIVDAADMCIMVDYWGTDNQLCDIGPMPWGDGIVDVHDLIVLAEHLFEEYPPVEPVE